MKAVKFALLPLLGLLVAAAAAPSPPPPSKLAPSQRQPLGGQWAGDGFALRATTKGYVVQGKCAAGKITSTIYPDASGAFTSVGYFNHAISGYRLSDIAPYDTPASFTGKLAGDTLALAMKVAGKAGEERFVLKRGATISFPKCD